MKKYLVVFLMIMFFGSLFADEPEKWPDKRAYFVGEVAGKSVQLDIKWFGNNVSGESFYGKSFVDVSGKVTGNYQEKLELNGEGIEWELQREFDPNYYGNYITNNTYTVKMERIAEWLDRTISFAGKSNVRVSYPYFLGKDIAAEKINILLELDCCKLENQFKEYLKKPEYFYLGISTRFDCQKSVSIKHFSKKLISLALEYDIYSGGAHGIYGIDTINVIEQDGTVEQLILLDLFTKDRDLSVLCDLIKVDLSNQEGADSIPEDNKMVIKMLNNFFITESGITFYFGPYLLGSYAAGDFEVTLSWDQLKDIVDKAGILKEFYNNMVI